MMSVTTGRPTVNVPVLSNSNTRPAASRSSASTALHNNTARGHPSQPGGDRDRRGEDQGTGCGHHQHCHRSDGIARQCPGESGNGEGHRQERHRVPIGESDERRTRRLGLRLGHQPHDPGVRAVGGASRGAHHERIAGIHGATPDTITGPAFDGKGLPRERRLVEHGDITLDTTVDGHDLTRPHQQQVTWRHVVDGR